MKGGTRLHGFSTCAPEGPEVMCQRSRPLTPKGGDMETITPKSPEIEKVLVHKATIIRCPECHSANVRIGTTTAWGTPIFCLECERMFPTRRA